MKLPGSDLDAALRASMTVAYYMVDDTVPPVCCAKGRFRAIVDPDSGRPKVLIIHPDDVEQYIWAGFSRNVYFVPMEIAAV